MFVSYNIKDNARIVKKNSEYKTKKATYHSVSCLGAPEETLPLAVTASHFGAWAPLAFCDRCAAKCSLFPPRAAVAFCALDLRSLVRVSSGSFGKVNTKQKRPLTIQ